MIRLSTIIFVIDKNIYNIDRYLVKDPVTNCVFFFKYVMPQLFLFGPKRQELHNTEMKKGRKYVRFINKTENKNIGEGC